MSPLNTLLAQLRAADQAYYNGTTVRMSDAQYDALREQVRLADPDNEEVQAYLKTVGAKPPEHLGKVEHLIHMGSQNKINTVDELLAWVAKRPAKAYVLSFKMDGASVEVVYVDGKLSRVSSRGDGITGSDITTNAAKWLGLPETILRSGVVVVRGEAIMSKTKWKANFSGDANPRNTCNGVIMRKDGEGNEYVMFVAFDTEIAATSYKVRLNTLAALGFTVVPHSVYEEPENLIKRFNEITVARADLDFEIDGVIVAIDDLAAQAALGFSDGETRPNGQVAWKFESASAETTVTSVVLSIGSTGAIIPTAQLAPVQIGGITISNCLLNNFEYIEALKLNIGDVVLVERAGDVIPHIVSVVKKVTPGSYQPPAGCPCCGSILEQDGKILKCVNDECEGKSYQLIKNWIKKTNIKHLGDGLLTALYESGKVTSIADLYQLTTVDLECQRVGQGRLGQSMAEKVIAEIDRTTTLDLPTFIGSLGIKYLGRSMVKHINLGSVEEFLAISVEDLAAKPEMGVNKARDMKESLLSKRDLVEKLQSLIMVAQAPKDQPKQAGGKTFCFSGVRMTPEIAAAFNRAGHQEKSGVSAGLDFLVLKDTESTSSKAQKARSLGITIISFDNFNANLKAC